MKGVHLVDAVRTPLGHRNGSLASVRPDDLAAHAIRELRARTPELAPARIEDGYLGNADGAGEANRDADRMTPLLTGLPTSVPGVTVNRLCHPPGASGARLAGTAAPQPARRGSGVGVATHCIGSGQGPALVLAR
ncbi:thiolase family protein [Streptomyces sp. NPDC002788]